jgi:prepilin-type N-terminal cleavage/methylation domain-containing protein
MKRSGFTMIELIFVIVILGILAAVAIPKLAATRDDAEVSNIAQSIGIGIQEIANYVTSKGKAASDLTKMSNSFESLQRRGKATITNNKAVIGIGSSNDCITVEVVTSTSSENIKVTQGTSNDSQCTNLQKLIDPTMYSVILRGNAVKY